MPFCHSRLCANLFCSLVQANRVQASRVQANRGGPLAAGISPPFSLYKKLPLAYSKHWAVFTIHPVPPAPLPAFFAFWRLL